MQLSDFDFELPEAQIARYPLDIRSASRLLHLDPKTGDIDHGLFSHILDKLKPGDCLVFNDTRVIPARLFANKSTGGKCELLVERLGENNEFLAHIKSSKSPKPNSILNFGDGFQCEVVEKKNTLYHCKLLSNKTIKELLDNYGHIPLPPYMNREDEKLDWERYQTVYNKNPGAVAAPTAGLHFDEPIMAALTAKGIEFAFLTLHVGAGTFQPVRVENIKEHKMHAEYIEVSEFAVDKINKTKKQGGRVIAVGTTSVRSLETASQDGQLKPYHGDSDIFIYPGFNFNCIDGMVTNFHLPKSSLIMLVSAFAGRENTLKAYQSAIDHNYRFYSYGDAMLLL